MPPRVLYGGISIDVGEKTQTEPVVVVVGRVCEAVNDDGVIQRMVNFPHPAVQLIVGNTAPVLRLLVGHWLSIGHIGGWVTRCGVHLIVHPRY